MPYNDDVPSLGNSISADVVDMEENYDCLSHINVWIPAIAMQPLSTNGATAGKYEYPTNDVLIPYFAFNGATEQFVSATLTMPENWNRSTIKAFFSWAPGDSACTAGDTVEWQLQGVSMSDNVAIDQAYTDTGEVISDTVLAGKDASLHISGKTPAITINGNPALNDLVNLKISRNVAGTDDMTEDAWLFGVFLQLVISEAQTVW